MGPDLLIVEDDPPVRRMLERSLRAEGFGARSAADGPAALVAVERATPDLVVLDVSLPGLDGFEVCRRLRDRGMAGGVLMLTARDAIEQRIEGLEAGADDYVVKPFAIEEVVARLRALERRGTDRSGLVSVGGLTLDTESHELRQGDAAPVELSPRESELLEMLMREPRVVTSRAAAVERIWGGAAVENVVDRYVARLRRKLENPRLIKTIWGVGFILDA